MISSPRLPAPRHFALPCAAPPPFVGARHAVPVFPFVPNPIVSLSPLNATLTNFLVTTLNKRLTRTLSPLDATLTKKPGVSVDTQAVPLES
jgi:hypothetical protein